MRAFRETGIGNYLLQHPIRRFLRRLVAIALCVLALLLMGSPASRLPSGPTPFLDGTRLDSSTFLYGSEIGGWPMLNGRYDGHPVLNYEGVCPDCPELVRDAGVAVIRWGVWNVFEGMDSPSGQNAPSMPRSQFDAVIDGIRNTLGAEPMLKLPPGQSNPPGLFCPEHWEVEKLLAFQKEIVSQAGPRVQLYDFANEPELACGYSSDWSSAGLKVGRLWIRTVPELKKHARALGFEIYVGGAAFTTTNISRSASRIDVDMAESFMAAIRVEYESVSSPYYHDPDLIPSFYSFHAYGVEYAANSGAPILEAIPHYGAYIDAVRLAINNVWGPDIGPRIRLACSEWNYAAEGPVDWSSPDVATYYSRFLTMLRRRQVWLAVQFVLASNGNGMDMITASGATTPLYDAFQRASRNDPIRALGGKEQYRSISP